MDKDIELLNRCTAAGFSKSQAAFIMIQHHRYLLERRQPHFDPFSFEDDMWYVMNRSGLFESFNWSPTHTRRFITF